MARAIPPNSGVEVRDHVRKILGKLQAHIREERANLLERHARSQMKRSLALAPSAGHLRPT